MLALGIDIGGTKIIGGIVDDQGNIFVTHERPTGSSKVSAVILEGVNELIQKLLDLYTVDVIGIGCCGRIDVQQGKVYYGTSYIPDWTGNNIKQYVESRHRITTVVDNDSNVAGIGEKWMGAGKDYSSLICITLGTGIAAAVFIDGQIVRGKHWSTGELGHMILHPHGKLCTCGQYGCFEQYCSGTSLYQHYNELRGADIITSGKQYFERLQSGDTDAKKVIEKFTDDLAISLVSLSNIIDPEVYIIGGGLIETKQYWWDQLLDKVQRYANPAVSHPVIIPAQYKNQAGILGAAKLGFDFLQEVKNVKP